MAVVKNLMVRAGADFSALKKETDKAQKTLSNFHSNIGGIMKKVGVVLGSLAVGKLIKDSTEMAMGVESAIDNINRNMGKSALAFQQWLETQSKALGMAKSDAYKYGSTFSNLLSSFSKSTKETATNTQELMKAAAIIASKTGRSYDDTANRIRSGMLGSTEAIEDLGVYTNISMLQSTEAFRKFAGDKSWAQLDFQTQQQIRLAAILEQTYARYGNTLADTTQTRQAQFIASLKNIQLSLGQAFLPIYNAVLPYLTAMANAIGKVVNLIAQFTTALFGSAKTGKSQIEAINSQVSGMNNLSSATAGAGKAAKKAAKDAKGSLASFDEINQLSESKAGSESPTGFAGSGAGAVAMPSLDSGGFASSTVEVSEKVQKMADRVRKAFNGIQSVVSQNKNKIVSSLAGIGAGIGTYLIGTHWDKIMKIVPKAMGIIIKAIGGINVPMVAIAILIGLVVKAVIELWKENQEFRDNIIKAWNGIKDTLTNIWNTILKPIFKAFIDMLLDIWNDGLKPLWDKWKEFVKQIVLLITDLWNGLKPVVDWMVKVFGPVIVDVFKGAYNQIKNAVLLIINIVNSILDAFSGIIKGIRQLLSGWIDFIAGVFTGDWSRAWNGIKNIFGGLKTEISSIWNGIKDIFGAIISYVGNYFKNSWSTGWNSVKGIFSGVFNGLKDIASNVFNSIKNTITNIIDGIKNTIGGIKATFSSVFNSLKDIIKAPLNAIISAINNSLGKISIPIPTWIPKIGGETFSIPKIPPLATGGITDVNNPFLAIVGDNKTQREVVAPLDDLQGMIASSVGTAVLNAMQFGGGNNSQPTGDIYLQMDGTTFARIIKPYQAKESQRVGNNLIIKTT